MVVIGFFEIMTFMKPLVLLLAIAAALPAAAPEGYEVWSHERLESYGAKLHPKIDAHKVGVEAIANWGNHRMMVAHREGNGQAELHERQADIFVVQTGEATLLLGGTMPGARRAEPNELRAASITGGTQKKLGPGDIVHIAPKVPHQMLVEPGKQITYVAFKIDVR